MSPEIEPQDTHDWQPSGGWGGPFIEFSEPQKLEEQYEECATCGAIRTRNYYAGDLYGRWRYNTNGSEGMRPCKPPHQHAWTILPPVPAFPGIIMARCECGQTRQRTKRGFRTPSLAEINRYLEALNELA